MESVAEKDAPRTTFGNLAANFRNGSGKRTEQNGVTFSRILLHLAPRSDDERGTVTVEYTVLLVLVAVTCVLGMAAAGVPLVRAHLAREAWLLFPFP